MPAPAHTYLQGLCSLAVAVKAPSLGFLCLPLFAAVQVEPAATLQLDFCLICRRSVFPME